MNVLYTHNLRPMLWGLVVPIIMNISTESCGWTISIYCRTSDNIYSAEIG